MKKLSFVLSALTLLLSTTSFAAENKDIVSAKVKAIFAADFAAATNVTWKTNGDFYFATFNLEKKEVQAAYDKNGDYFGGSRVIAMEDLPLNISKAIKENYSKYTIGKEITEVSFEGVTSYYFTAENSSQILTIKSDAFANFSIEGKTKK